MFMFVDGCVIARGTVECIYVCVLLLCAQCGYAHVDELSTSINILDVLVLVGVVVFSRMGVTVTSIVWIRC